MAEGPHAEIVCAYFQHVRLLLVEGLVLGDISVATLRGVTAKELYEGYSSTFHPPKVVFKFDVDWCLVWKILNSLSLNPVLYCPKHSSKQTEVIHQDEHSGGSSQLFAVCGGGGQHPHIHRVCDGQGGLGLDEIEIAQLITRRMQQNFKF